MTNNIDLALPIIDDAFRRVSVVSLLVYSFLLIFDIASQDNGRRGRRNGPLPRPARRLVPRIKQRVQPRRVREMGPPSWMAGSGTNRRYYIVRLSVPDNL